MRSRSRSDRSRPKADPNNTARRGQHIDLRPRREYMQRDGDSTSLHGQRPGSVKEISLTENGDSTGRSSESGSTGGGASGGIVSLITKNVPALRPDHRSFVVVNGVLALVLLGVLLSSPDVTTVKWLTAGTLVYFALNSALLFLLAGKSRKCERKATTTAGDGPQNR